MDRLQSIQAFCKVVEEGSFVGAARALSSSPAVVTRHVADLEDHLGTRLLQRTTRRVSLTEQGQAYYERISVVIEEIDEIGASVSSLSRELSGQIRMSAPPILSNHVLAPIVAEFRRIYPNITFDLVVELHGEVDLAGYDLSLMANRVDFDSAVVARRVFTTETVLLASPAYLQRKGVPEKPADLARHDGLMLRLPSFTPRGWRLFENSTSEVSEDVRPQVGLTSNHLDTLIRAAVEGAGITAATSEIAATLLERGDLVRVLSPWVLEKVVVHAALPSRQFIPGRVKAFLDFLVRRAQENADRPSAPCEVAKG